MTVTGMREGDDAFDPKSWLSLLLDLAEAHAARCDLDGLANDIAQQAFAVLWDRLKTDGREFQADEAARLVRELAEAERHARDAERCHLVLLRRDAPGWEPPPDLCPCLSRLAGAHARPGAFRTRLHVAAHCLARHPRILLNDQFRILDLVWVGGASVRTAAGLLAISEDAARKRLTRTSDRLEKRLLLDLEPALPGSAWDDLRRFLWERDRRPPSRAAADAVFAGLARVIHIRTLWPEMS